MSKGLKYILAKTTFYYICINFLCSFYWHIKDNIIYLFSTFVIDNNAPYHTVMLKDEAQEGERITYHTVMLKGDGTDKERVKSYHCMTCNINADNLDEFKKKPCKIRKWKYLPVS
jgi:hypothetical protein